MSLKINIPKIKNKKKLIIKLSIFAFLYLVVIAMFLSFGKERDTSFKGLMREGDEYLKQGKNAIALEHFKNIASKYPDNEYIHLKLGDLYTKNKNVDLAKIEYFQAVELAPDSIEAHVSMADLYLANGDYDLAEKVIDKLDEKNSEIKMAKGEFYLKLGSKIKNPQDSLLALQKAYRYLDHTDNLSLEKTKNLLSLKFINLANQYLNNGDKYNAVKNLKIALKYNQAPEVYNALAGMYVGNDDRKALNYVKKSLELSNKQKNLDKCYELLMAIGKNFLDADNLTYAKYAFLSAKNINPEKEIPYYEDNPVLVNIISTQFNEETNGNKIPGISFKITNITKEKIKYLNSKIVFLKGNNVFSEAKLQLAYLDTPIAADSFTSAINVFSPKPIEEIADVSNYSVKIYLSTKQPDEWKIYRNVSLSKPN
jgi:tetratricopeptide (TPR) repeat protein